MQIPVDILAQLIPQVDFGNVNRRQAGIGESDGFRFDEILSEAQSRPQQTDVSRPETAQPRPEATTRPDAPETPDMPDEDDLVDECVAAGMLGNYQSNVIVILEGDMESGTNPEVQAVEVTAPPAATDHADVQVEVAQVAVEYVSPEVQAVVGETAQFTLEPVSQEEAAMLIGDEEQTAGEVTARMPAIRTSEESGMENNQNNAQFSEYGELSPLENENDARPVNGQETFGRLRDNEEAKTEEFAPQETAIPLTNDLRPERFISSQELQQAAQVSEAPVAQENLFDEMVAKIQMMNVDGQTGMSIQLKPSVLGQVSLQLIMSATGLALKINAEDMAVRGAIFAQVDSLIESLEEKGIRVQNVEVTYTDVNSTLKDPKESGGETASRNNRKSRDGQRTIDGVEAYTPVPDIADHYLDAEISTVEFRA